MDKTKKNRNHRMKIAFVWQGITGRYGVWNDGLREAMRLIEEKHDVTYCEPGDKIKADIILYWEAPCTINGPDKEKWLSVYNNRGKKCLLFAGGPIKKEWIYKFDHIFVESKINLKEMREMELPVSVAFGINEKIMKPMDLPKLYDGIHHGTSASWKRQQLVGEALGPKGMVVGRYQKTDSMPFDECKKRGTVVLDEQDPEIICELLNQSHTLLQTSDFWGGGQRATLEAMACNVPVVCMTDSPKNREYVEESGFGLVVEPNAQEIKEAVEKLKKSPPTGGREYILGKWTAKHYADNLLKVIEKL